MSVILLILKIIGIVLLALLGIILAVICVALFVPIRYRVNGEIEEEKVVHVRITWLLHLVSWSADYKNDKFDSCLRILGIRKKPKPTLSELEEETADMDEEDEDEDIETAAAETKAVDQEKTLSESKAIEEARHLSRAEAVDTRQDVVELEDSSSVTIPRQAEKMRSLEESEKFQKQLEESEVSGQPKRPDFFEKIALFFQKIRQKYEKIKQAIPRIKAKLSNIKKKASDIKSHISNIKDMIMDENNKIAFASIWKELKYLLLHFKFRRIDTDITFSLGDPANTGQALGVLAMMPLLYQYNFHIYPDFEADESYVRGTFLVKGRVRLVHVVRSLVQLLRKKEIRLLLSKFMNSKK